MFEKQLTDVLNAKLSWFLEGIDPEDVRLGVLNGDVCVRRVRVRGSALTKILDEPSVRVRHGVVDELRLRIPWRNLGKEPVSVLFKGIYVVAEIDESGAGLMDEEGEAEREERLGKKALRAARRAANAAERAWLKCNPAVDAEALEVQNKKDVRLDIRKKRSGIAGLIDVVLANLAIEVSHVHVRVEGSYGERNVPCGMGFTLERMTLSTVGENMEQTVFQVAGFADRLRKAVRLERMGAYADFDSPSVAANTPDSWKGISDELFVRRMSSVFDVTSSPGTTSAALATAYIFGPVQGLALYTRRGYAEADEGPLHEIRADVRSIQVSVKSTQFKVFYTMYSNLRVSRVRYAYSHIRPSVSVVGHTREWWTFALKGVQMHIRELNKRKGLDFRSSVDALMRINRARERYVPLYVQHLRAAPPPPECYARDRADQKNQNWPPSLKNGELSEIDEIEKQIPLQSIVTFRTLAHLEYRKSGGVQEAVARERKRRLRKNLVTKTVLGLAHGGAKNTASVLKVVANPLRGIVRAVTKKDSRDLVLQQQRARVAQENTESTWREDLETTLELSERSVALETKALSASIELSFTVYIEDVSLSVIDDEIFETGTTANSASRREIVRLALSRIALGTVAGPGRTERCVSVQGLAMVSPEGTLMKFSPKVQPLSGTQANLWKDSTHSHALYLQIIRGDVDVEEDVSVKVHVASSKTIIMREPLDRVLQVAARNKVTSSYIGSFILEDEATERNYAGSIEKQNSALNAKPKIRLEAMIENPIIIMAGEGSNLLIDLGKTSINTVPPVSAGVDRALAHQHNAFSVRSTGVRAGFIDDNWSISANESILWPLLSMSATNVTFAQSLHQAAESPNIILMSNLSSLDVSFSPARLFKIKALKQVLKSPPPRAAVAEQATVASVKSDLHQTEVRILQRDDANGELIWIPAQISVRQNKFLDVRVMDGLRSRDICVNVTESKGASRLRGDVCDQLFMNGNVMCIGGAFNSVEELKNSLDSDDFITLAFDDSGNEKKPNTIDIWYNLINGIVRENVATLVDPMYLQKKAKTQALLKFAVENVSFTLLCPLLAHPAEDEEHARSTSTERTLVSARLEQFTGEIAAAGTCKQIGLNIGSLILLDDYSTVALGRECIAAICGTGSSKSEAISVGITLLRQDDARYIGIDKLIEIDIHEKLDLRVRRSTLLALCALRFVFRPSGFKPNIIMPDVAQRVMVSGELIKRIKREIRLNLTSARANAYYDHSCEEDIPAVTLQLDDVYWGTTISPPTRETVVSVGVLKLATGKMAMKGEWNLQPSSNVSDTTLLLKNNVYDRGEEADGADVSLDVELGGLDVLMTPEMREIGPFLSFFGAIKPDHIEKFVHPCDRPREGFTHLKIRMSIKVDSPKIIFTVPAIDSAGAHTFVIHPGNIEVSRCFASKRIQDDLSICFQSTILKIDGLEAFVMSQNGDNVSALMRKPLSLKVSLQKRIDSGPSVTNEIDDKNELQLRPIFLDISGVDFRCAHDGLKHFLDVEVREKVTVTNPINWGRVDALPAKTQTPASMRSVQALVTLSSAQISIYKRPSRVRPISTIKVVGIHVFALKNLNGKSAMELDVTLKVFGIDDDSQSFKHQESAHLLYAGAQNCPFLRVTLREDDELKQLHATLQHVELLVKPGIMLDTVQTFAPRRMGGVYLPGMILPKDVYCSAGGTLVLSESLNLTTTTRLLADDPHMAGGIYRVNGHGHMIKFLGKDGQPIYRHTHGQRRKTMPRIIVGHKATLKFENVVFKCTRSALSRFIKLAPEASFTIGLNVHFDDADELEFTANDLAIVSKSAGASSKERREVKDDLAVNKVKKRFLAEVNVACVHIVLGAEFAKADQLHILFGLAAHIEQHELIGNSMKCELLRLRTKDTMKPPLLKPFVMTLQVESRGGVSKCTGSLTPVAIELTPHRISILRRAIDRIARSFAIAPLLRCGVYSCIWDGSLASGKGVLKELLVQRAEARNTSYTVWRPVAPSGYGSLADVVKSESGAPETEVWIARDTPAICTLPEKFEKVEGSEFPCFWRPVAPKGFISLGLVASISAEEEPPLDCVRCIRQELVTNVGEVSTRVNFDLYGDTAQSALTLWQTDNAVAGFTCAETRRMPGDARPSAYDIRKPAGFQTRLLRKSTRNLNDAQNRLESSCATVVDFKKVGMVRNRDSVIGFWAAVPPSGYVSTGHCISAGETPPLHTCVFADDKNIFQPPRAFHRLAPLQSFGDTRGQRFTIWRPVPPEGFLGVGVLVTSDDQEPSLEASIVCVRSDLVQLARAGQFTSKNAFCVFEETSPTPIHFWITNDKTHNFIASIMDSKSEELAVFDFDVGYMGDASNFDSERPKLQLKFEVPSVCVGMAFERLFQNQTLFMCQLESTRIDHTKRLKSSNLSMETSFSIMHRNARVGNALEPVLAPWKLSFLLDNKSNDIMNVVPASSNMRIQSIDECSLMLNQALIVDVMDALAQLKRPADENARAARMRADAIMQSQVIINSTGRNIWVRKPNGEVEEVPVGSDIAEALRNDKLEVELESTESEFRGRADIVDGVSHRGDERLAIAYMSIDIVDISEVEIVNKLLFPRLTFKIWDKRMKKLHLDPLPVSTLSGSVHIQIPHPLLRGGKEMEYVHESPVNIIVELSSLGSTGEASSVQGSIEVSTEELRNDWIRDKHGFWVDCTEGNGEPVRIKLRARVVEGLTRSPIMESSDVARILTSPRKVASSKPSMRPPLIVCRTNDLVKVWWTKGRQQAKKALSAWHPHQPSHDELAQRHTFFEGKSADEYTLVPFGTILRSGLNAPRSALMAVVMKYNANERPPTAFPIDFEKVWEGDKKRVSFWKPVAPQGYVSIGNVVVSSSEKPSTNCVVCVRQDFAEVASLPPSAAWKSNVRFRSIQKGRYNVIQNGDSSTGGWTFLKERLLRAKDGTIKNKVPQMHKLDQSLCIPSLEDEGTSEIWFDNNTHLDRMKLDLQIGESVLVLAFSPEGPFEQVNLQLGSSHVVRHKTHDLVFDGINGRLLSRITVENETQIELIAEVQRFQGSHMLSSARVLSLDEDDEVVEVFEAERYYPFRGWATPRDAVHFSDRFSTHRNGSRSTRFFPEVRPPKGYKFDGPWRLDVVPGLVDENGWAYRATPLTTWPPPPGCEKRKARSTRRRRWVRDIVRVKTLELFAERASLQTMKRDALNNWRGDLAIDGSITLPPVSRSDPYTLNLHRDGVNCSFPEKFPVSRLSEQDDCSFSYTNGVDHFIFVVHNAGKNQDSAVGAVPTTRLRVTAPVHVHSNVRCRSHVSIYAGDKRAFSDEMLVNETKRITTIDAGAALEMYVALFAENLVLCPEAPVRLREVTPAGSPPAPQCEWLSVKGYPHLTSPLLLDAARARLTANANGDDPSQQLLSINYRSMLVITNASSICMKFLTRIGGTSSATENINNFVELPPGWTLPGMFVKSAAQKSDKVNVQEFVLELCIDDSPIRVTVSARSKPVMITLPTLSGDRYVFNCSAAIGHGEESTPWPTIEVVVQPALVVVNLTHLPLAIRANNMGFTIIKPSSCPAPLSLDVTSSLDAVGIESALNQAAVQIADASSGESNMEWSAPLKNLVRSSGAFWSLPSSADPSAGDVDRFKLLPHTDEDGEPVNFTRPLIIQLVVERSEQGCFRIFFKGGNGSALHRAPIFIQNHMPKPVIIRQVRSKRPLKQLQGKISKRAYSKLVSEMDIGVGQSFAIREQSCASWALNEPGMPIKLDISKKVKKNTSTKATDLFQMRQFLEISSGAGEHCMVEVNSHRSNFIGFMPLGELEFFDRPSGDKIRAIILGEWRDDAFFVFLAHETPAFVNFSYKEELARQSLASAAHVTRKESHLAVNLASCSLTIIDRARKSYAELLRISIDDVEIERGINLFAGQSSYHHVGISALQIDFSEPGATYPVFVWHDPSVGKLFETFVTISKDHSHDIVVHRFELMMPKDGIVVRAGEELVWALLDFLHSLRAQMPQSFDASRSRAPRSGGKKKSRDTRLHVEAFGIEALSFIVTFDPNSNIRPKDAYPKVVALLTFASLQGLRLTLERFERSHENTVRSNLISEYVKHIKSQMVAQTLSIMTSMQTLTNVSTGLDAMSKVVGSGFGVLTSNKVVRQPSSLVRSRKRTEMRNNIAAGVFLGLRRFGQDVAMGLIGLVVIPFRGAREGGLVGACKGCARGVTNAVVKPVAGAISLAAKTVEGVANTARDVRAAAWELVNTSKVSKARVRRLPLAVRSDGIIRPWNALEALGVYCMRMSVVSSTSVLSYAPGILDNFASMHKISGNLLLIITNNRCMAVGNPAVDDGGLPIGQPMCHWYISWSDVSSIWRTDGIIVNVQLDMSSDDSNLGNQNESLIEKLSRFVIRATSQIDAQEIEASMRRCWHAVLGDTE